MGTNRKSQRKEIQVIGILRAVAALLVCMLHYTNGPHNFLSDNIFKAIGSKGWVGVQIFFVISGFIIPLALSRARYTVNCLPRFIVKRLIRLHPTFVVATITALVLGYATYLVPTFSGEPYSIDLHHFFAQFFYLSGILNTGWINSVAWTLAIELQYYFAIGLLFPLLASHNNFLRFSTGVGILLLSLLPINQAVFLPHWGLNFLFGIIVFQHKIALQCLKQTLSIILILGIFALHHYGIEITIACLATSLLILWEPRIHLRFLNFIGTISYSFYLFHSLIGIKCINLGSRFTDSWIEKTLLLFVSFSLSILISWIVFRCVEVPSQRFSSSLSLRKRREKC